MKTEILLTKEQMCDKYGCTMEKLETHLEKCKASLIQMREKAVRTGKKVNGFPLSDIDKMINRY